MLHIHEMQQETTSQAGERTQKINKAASFLGASWNGEECVYFDDGMRKYYVCDDEDEMIDLYDLIHHDDQDIARDAYSHWCAQTCHAEEI